MTSQRSPIVRAAAFRKNALRLAKAFSIGLKSGGRQVAQCGPCRFDRSAHVNALVCGYVVHDDCVASPERWDQHLLDVSLERRPVHGSIKDHGRGHTVIPPTRKTPAARRDRPPKMAATNLERRSVESGLPMHAGLLPSRL